MNTEIKFVKRISVRETLISIPIGQSRIIKTKYIKPSSIRSAVRRLNKENKNSFEATEEGLIDEMKVTRHK